MSQIDEAVALVTFEQVKDYVGNTATDHMNMLIQLTNSVSADCSNRYCKRNFLQATYTNEYYNGTGQDTLALRNYPVASVSELKIEVDGVALVEGRSDDFVIAHAGAGILQLLGGVFPVSVHGIDVSYVAGYLLADVPDDLQMSVLEAIMFRFSEFDKKRWGVESQDSSQGHSSTYIIDQYPKHVIAIWEHYRAKHVMAAG